MEAVEMRVYTFDELSPEAKEKVLERHRDINVHGYWYASSEDWWQYRLEDLGFLSPEIHFSGFWSQGDGAYFDCNSIDIETFVKAHPVDIIQMFFPHMNVARRLAEMVGASIEVVNHHSCHHRTRRIKLEEYGIPDEFAYMEKALQKKWDELEGLMEWVREEKCKEIYRSLQKDYEAAVSDESVAETLRCNDYHFTADGDDWE